MNSLSRGKRASGDLIPWTVSQQFNDHDFAGLSGGRIVRIATHPDFQGVRLVRKSFSHLLLEVCQKLAQGIIELYAQTE